MVKLEVLCSTHTLELNGSDPDEEWRVPRFIVVDLFGSDVAVSLAIDFIFNREIKSYCT